MKEKSSILMLEDDPDDRFLTESTMNELGYPTQINFVKNSNELFSFLESDSKPFLILLDYNSSPLSAVEILKVLKNNDHYKSIPVVVLSDSSSPKYLLESYANGASSYVKKPASMLDTKNKIKVFFEYWLTIVEV